MSLCQPVSSEDTQQDIGGHQASHQVRECLGRIRRGAGQDKRADGRRGGDLWQRHATSSGWSSSPSRLSWTRTQAHHHRHRMMTMATTSQAPHRQQPGPQADQAQTHHCVVEIIFFYYLWENAVHDVQSRGCPHHTDPAANRGID